MDSVERIVEKAIRVSQLNAGHRSATPKEVAENGVLLGIASERERIVKLLNLYSFSPHESQAELMRRIEEQPPPTAKREGAQ